MLIQALVLENVKSYADGEIRFGPGTNVIVGHNGAGKSTILEAIGFALFDHLPYSQADFVREGAKSATVTVTFLSSADDRAYQVVRRCGSSSAYAVLDPELGLRLCEGKADVLAFLREHIGVDATANLSDLFANAVGVPQGTFTSAFLATPSQRKGVFDPLLRVEEYNKAWSGLREPRRLLAERQTQLDIQISALEARLERLPVLQETIQRLNAEIQANQQHLEQIETALAQVQAERETLDGLRRELQGAQAAVEQARQAVAHAEREAALAQGLADEARTAHQLVEAHRAGHEAYQAALAQQRTLEEQVRARQRLRDQQAQLETEMALARAEQARLEQALAEIAAAESRATQLAEAVAQQDRLEAARREAEQRAARLAAATETLRRQRAAVEQAAARLAQLETQAAQVEAVETALAQAEASISQHQEAIRQAQEQVARLRAEEEALQEQVAALNQVETAQCPVCEQPLTPEHREALLARNTQRLAEVRAEQVAAAAALQAAQAELAAAQKAVRQNQATLRSLPRAQEVTEAARQVQAAREALQQAEAEQQALADAPEAVEQARQALQALGDPRQEQAIALQTAARRPQTEQAFAQVQNRLAALQEDAGKLAQQLAAFAHLDQALQEVNERLRQHQEADDIFRRNEQAALALPAREERAAAAGQALRAAQEELAAREEAFARASERFDPQRFQAVTAQEQSLREEQGRLAGALRERERQRGAAETELAGLQAQQAQLAEAQQQRARLQEQAELLEKLRSVLREAGPYVTKALVQQISYGAAQLFSDIMQDHTRHLQWTEDYGIVLEVDGRPRQFSQLSGGEQMSAALAVRLALLQEMSDVAVAFFDEPTTNLDETRRESLAQQILAIQGFQQLFVISHDDAFEQATENLIRVQRVNGLSQAESPV